VTGYSIVVAPLGADAALVALDGRIGPLDAQDAADELTAVARETYRRVLVDASSVEVDDADVLVAVYDLARALRARNGLVAVIAPSRGELAGIVRSTGLDAVISLYDSRRAALDDLDLPDPT
jgi:anti-anti-sigma regulatory factor